VEKIASLAICALIRELEIWIFSSIASDFYISTSVQQMRSTKRKFVILNFAGHRNYQLHGSSRLSTCIQNFWRAKQQLSLKISPLSRTSTAHNSFCHLLVSNTSVTILLNTSQILDYRRKVKAYIQLILFVQTVPNLSGDLSLINTLVI
jgi:hypothetical protein